MRRYRLFVRNRRRYEVVPVGFSWGALLLGPIWAAAYGLLLRYSVVLVLATIPVFVAGLFEGSVRDAVGLIGLAVVIAGHVYFAFNAFAWRQLRLASIGFEELASISAKSARDALTTWSGSDEASAYLGNAP